MGQGPAVRIFQPPAFAPQFLLRLAVAFTLGSLFAIMYLLFTRPDTPFRRDAIRFIGAICMVSLVLIPPLSAWYYTEVPLRYKTHIIFGILTSHLSQHPQILPAAAGAALLTVLSCAWFAWRRKAPVVKVLVIPALVLSIAFVFVFERTREFIRGPYVMPGYLYAANVLLTEGPLLNRDGLLPQAYWFNMLGQDDPVNRGLFCWPKTARPATPLTA